MKKVLIAGGTGFVGQNTARFYADAGIPVVVTSRKDKDPVAEKLLAYSDLISLEKIDLVEADAVERLFAKHDFEHAIFLAQTHQAASTRKEINLIYPIVLNFLESARSSGVKRVALASSIAVYGATHPPFTEDMTFHPSIEYTPNSPRLPRFEIRVKRIVEELFMDYAVPMDKATSGSGNQVPTHELEVVILRLPMQFGPGYIYAGNPVSIACHAAADKVKDLVNQTGYLNAPVPFLWNRFGLFRPLYVKDTASAFKTVLEAEKLPRPIYNVHSGFTNSARKQYEAVVAAAGANGVQNLNIPTEVLTDVEIDSGFSNEQLCEDFGWKSGYTMESACKDYIDWLADNDV